MNLDAGAVITLCIFMVVHLCGTVWWMSKVNATLGFVGTQIQAILNTMAGHDNIYARKEDTGTKLAFHDQQLLAIWKRLDQPHACPNDRVHHERKV